MNAKHVAKQSGAGCADVEKAARGRGEWLILGPFCCGACTAIESYTCTTSKCSWQAHFSVHFWFFCSFENVQFTHLPPIQILVISICFRFVSRFVSRFVRRCVKQVTREEYLWLTASADHSNHPDKVVQGRRAMAMLDLDRNLRAVESQVGYVTEYYQMVPEECTPKNQILVGRLGKNG